MQELIKSVYIHPSLMEYMVSITCKTRNHKSLALGVSPRGSLGFLRAVQAYAAIVGFNYVTPEFIIKLAPFVLCHRFILRTGFQKSAGAADILADILAEIPVPTEDFARR
jgi:MoxR-like ATPase